MKPHKVDLLYDVLGHKRGFKKNFNTSKMEAITGINVISF